VIAGSVPVLVHNCTPSDALMKTADEGEIRGADFAAEYTSPSGATYRAHNKSGINIPDGMRDELPDLITRTSAALKCSAWLRHIRLKGQRLSVAAT
jgi:hypothetical protein